MKSTKLKCGVLVRLVIKDRSTVLSLDDVEEVPSSPRMWRKMQHVTFQDVDESKLEKMDFDEKELADFGYYILARIRAFKVME